MIQDTRVSIVRKCAIESNQLLNIMIGLVVVLILIVGASIIIGNNDDDGKESVSEQKDSRRSWIVRQRIGN